MKTPIAALALAAVLGASAFAQDNAIPSWSRTRAMPEHSGSVAERGAAVFNNWCSACHGHDTARNNAPGTKSLQYKYHGELPAALQDRKDLTVEFVKYTVRHGVATMPFFRPTEISDENLNALAAYLARKP